MAFPDSEVGTGPPSLASTLGSSMKLRHALILACISASTGCTTGRNSTDDRELALQYATLKRPVEKATFCLQHTAFFFKAPPDDEIGGVFGEDAQLPSVVTTRPEVLWHGRVWATNAQDRVVRIYLTDEYAPYGVQLPPPWECVAHYTDHQLVWLYVQPFRESK